MYILVRVYIFPVCLQLRSLSWVVRILGKDNVDLLQIFFVTTERDESEASRFSRRQSPLKMMRDEGQGEVEESKAGSARPETSNANDAEAKERKREHADTGSRQGTAGVAAPAAATSKARFVSIVVDERGRSNVVADSTSPYFMALTPSCVEDFTEEWVLYVMQQYYENNFAESITKIGRFSAEKADGEASSDALPDEDESASSSGGGADSTSTTSHHHSHHVLSDAYKVMVDVPDPPGGGDGPEDEDKREGEKEEEEKKSPASSAMKKAKSKIHHLFVKIPPKRTAKFERMVRRNRTLEHEVKVYSELLRDLKKFVKERVGNAVELRIPQLYHTYEDGTNDNHVLVIEDLAKKGFETRDWFRHKLTHNEVLLAVDELAKFHACGLAYRMSLKEEIDDKYPYLDDDLYTSNMAKELLAKYLDSFLHFLSLLPGIQEHVLKLRKISNEVFQLLVKLRRPSDPLGIRFNTVCHGDMWMGNLMFKGDEACTIIDFHSAQFLSPATDLAHLLLTSTSRAYRQEKWDEVVEAYYDTFNRTLAEFGLILRHLGTTYNDFLYEVRRALRGQFLCVAFIIPIGKFYAFFISLDRHTFFLISAFFVSSIYKLVSLPNKDV